jgi:hypothetical protein
MRRTFWFGKERRFLHDLSQYRSGCGNPDARVRDSLLISVPDIERCIELQVKAISRSINGALQERLDLEETHNEIFNAVVPISHPLRYSVQGSLPQQRRKTMVRLDVATASSLELDSGLMDGPESSTAKVCHFLPK